MPIRGGTYGEADYIGPRIFRSLIFGNLLKVIALEGRLIVRQLSSAWFVAII